MFEYYEMNGAERNEAEPSIIPLFENFRYRVRKIVNSAQIEGKKYGSKWWNRIKSISLAPVHSILNDPNYEISFHSISFCSASSDSINPNKVLGTLKSSYSFWTNTSSRQNTVGRRVLMTSKSWVILSLKLWTNYLENTKSQSLSLILRLQFPWLKPHTENIL